MEAFNNAMQAVYNQVTKVPCACGRTFKDAETLARHAKTCPAAASTPAAPSGRDSASLSSSMAGLSVKGGAGKAGATGSGTTTADGDGGARAGSGSRAPLSYVCYLCGRQFGSASLLMHVDKCVEKWRATEASRLPLGCLASSGHPGPYMMESVAWPMEFKRALLLTRAGNEAPGIASAAPAAAGRARRSAAQGRGGSGGIQRHHVPHLQRRVADPVPDVQQDFYRGSPAAPCPVVRRQGVRPDVALATS